ncbi:uncharacterized protein [Sinocyclocheilus grahami]|uniref:uncharacterized protein n=1 Tax=Sinocyclocheilus grahami TaxID=75366 RepID=UPI0007ACB01D|nr:PREDICTED: uncharacterized protein LOC107568435 [Sinocyclocheilus grahami]
MMDPDEEIIAGVRPKRHTRPPAYLQQYEEQYSRGRPVAEYDVPHPWEAPVHRTPPPSFQPYATPPGGYLVCSDGSRMSSNYQPPQHAEFHQPSFSSPQAAGFISSAHDSELQHLRHEHAQLMQTHQAFQADLRELRDVRSEVRELVQVALSLRADLQTSQTSETRGQNLSPAQPPVLQLSSPPVRRYESTPLAENENFADLPLPPWPEPDVDLMNQVGDLALSDMGVTVYQPVIPETRKYSFVFPAKRLESIPLCFRLMKHALLSIMLLTLVGFPHLLPLKSFESSSHLRPCPYLLTARPCLFLRDSVRYLLIRILQPLHQRQSPVYVL